MATPLRFGLIGAGRWGRVYIRTLESLPDRCQLTYLCTSDPRNAQLVRHPVSVVADWRELIKSSCDAVIIATPPDTHAQLLEACLEVGKPCIVEKPLCLDVAVAERLDRRVQESGVPVLVDHTYIFHPAYLALKQALDASSEPIRLVCFEGMGFGPFRPRVPALWDWGPHDASLCLDLMREVPHQVSALGGPVGAGGTPEAVSIRLDFASGACAWIQTGRIAPQKRRNLNVFTDTRYYRFDHLASPQLTVAAVSFPRRYTDGIPERLDISPIPLTSRLSLMTNVVTCFLDGLSDGDRSKFGTSLALEVTRLLARCEEAMRSRAVVPDV